MTAAPGWLARVGPGAAVRWSGPGRFRGSGVVVAASWSWPGFGCGWCCGNCGTEAWVLCPGPRLRRVGACVLEPMEARDG